MKKKGTRVDDNRRAVRTHDDVPSSLQDDAGADEGAEGGVDHNVSTSRQFDISILIVFTSCHNGAIDDDIESGG